jgi:hypothetical protein
MFSGPLVLAELASQGVGSNSSDETYETITRVKNLVKQVLPWKVSFKKITDCLLHLRQAHSRQFWQVRTS